MLIRLMLAYSFFVISLGLPPLLLISVPMLFVTTRTFVRRVREGRADQRALEQVKGEQAYIRALRHQANGGF